MVSLAQSVVWVRDGSTQLMGTAAQAEADWRFGRDYLGSGDRHSDTCPEP